MFLQPCLSRNAEQPLRAQPEPNIAKHERRSTSPAVPWPRNERAQGLAAAGSGSPRRSRLFLSIYATFGQTRYYLCASSIAWLMLRAYRVCGPSSRLGPVKSIFGGRAPLETRELRGIEALLAHGDSFCFHWVSLRWLPGPLHLGGAGSGGKTRASGGSGWSGRAPLLLRAPGVNCHAPSWRTIACWASPLGGHEKSPLLRYA